jgi:hypothetical protein
VALPDDYWTSYESVVESLADFLEAVRRISAYQAATGAKFVWRGVTNANWPLHSRLFREHIRTRGTTPNERQLRSFERTVIEEARDWGLDWHERGGRLTALELLASMQHFGAPTRLLDFTFQPLVALWFAVEAEDDRDGRIFAIDISDRLLDREAIAKIDPWWFETPPSVVTDWTKRSWIWRPPPLEARISRQEGCFLMGGVPSTNPRRNIRVGGGWRSLRTDEVRACMSVPFSLIVYEQAEAAYDGRRLRSRPPATRSFTVRVRGKSVLRGELERAFGYSHTSLFPDLPGFATYGRSWR